MKKVHNKGFIFFLLCVFIISIGYPFYKKYYIKPQKWKEVLINEIKNNNRNVPDSLIKECSNCVYSDFKNRYGSVDKFPARNNYNKEDKLTIVRCTIEFLIMDPVKKELARSRLDSLATQL
jgi:hypothetical protein